MRMASTMAISPPLLSADTSVLREMLTVDWIVSGRKRKPKSDSSREREREQCGPRTNNWISSVVLFRMWFNLRCLL
nr:hypothetical protein CFP56_71661 [Quercus suber]